MHPIPKTMKAPADKRAGWLVLQVMITRACTESCFHCTQASNLAGKPAVMTIDEFETAIKSLHGFPGTIGVFGGQPTLHPKFPEICEVMRKHVPFKHRGLWTNSLNGYGAICRETFNPARSNLNVHTSHANYDEIVSDWPEAIKARPQHTTAGVTTDSTHSSPWVAIKDVIPDEAERWELIGKCTINQFWSAIIGTVPGRGLRAFLCELMYAQAAMHADNPDWDGTGQPMPDLGMPVVPGWWQLPLSMFESQIRLHCHACGLAMNRKGQLAIGGEREEFSQTHRHIARPKVKDRPVAFVGVESLIRSERPATEYISGVTPGYKGA